MGVHKNIDRYKFPQQGTHLHKRVRVCWNYDTNNTIDGIIVRDDVESPGVEIIRLDDGRYMLTTECQYMILQEARNATSR